MKTLAMVLVCMISTSAMAQILATDLNREGAFEKKFLVAVAGSKKQVTKSSTRVRIEKNSANSYLLTIQKSGSGARACYFQAEAFSINQVQMIANVGDCEVTVGYTSPTELAVMTNGQCADFCTSNAKLETSNVRRTSGSIRK